MEPKELASQLRKPSGEKGIETGKMMNDGNKHMYALTYSFLKLNEGESILEIGFGNGKFIAELVDQHHIHYCGIDFSETMVQEAITLNQNYIRAGQVEIKNASLSEIPFSDQSFDKIFTINTLYFWENPIQDIQEIKRVMKDGGEIFITIRPKHLVQGFEFTNYGFTLYEAEEVEKFLLQAGFKETGWKEQMEPEFDMQGKKVKFESVCIWGKK